MHQFEWMVLNNSVLFDDSICTKHSFVFEKAHTPVLHEIAQYVFSNNLFLYSYLQALCSVNTT